MRAVTGEGDLAFFDAIAPVIHRESIDTSIAWFQSRYNKAGPAGTGADYLNCPMTREEYDAFVDALLAGDKTSFKEWEASTPYFDGCLPIEVMAERGRDTLRYGPMKPVGLDDPRTGRWPYAVVQLRQDNALGSLWNMVGFQTKLKHAEQVRIFRMIPGLAEAEFARLGGLHRNTFLNSPKLLDASLRLKAMPRLRFAGQITGVEGYVESAAIGLLAGRFAAAERLGRAPTAPPPTTALGALIGHITGGHLSVERSDGEAHSRSFQPMNINYGLLPDIDAPAAGRRRQATQGQGQGPRQEARHVGARARRHRSLARCATPCRRRPSSSLLQADARRRAARDARCRQRLLRPLPVLRQHAARLVHDGVGDGRLAFGGRMEGARIGRGEHELEPSEGVELQHLLQQRRRDVEVAGHERVVGRAEPALARGIRLEVGRVVGSPSVRRLARQAQIVGDVGAVVASCRRTVPRPAKSRR